MSNNIYSLLPTLRAFSTQLDAAKTVLAVPHAANSPVHHLQMVEIKKMESISMHFVSTLLQQCHNNERVFKQLNLLSNCWQTTIASPSLNTTARRIKALSDVIDSIVAILETAEIQERINQLEEELEINTLAKPVETPSTAEEIENKEEKKEAIKALPLPLPQMKPKKIMKKVRFELPKEEKEESDDIQTECVDDRKSFPRLRGLMRKVASRLGRD